MDESPDELVSLGVVARPHGVRGELRVHRWNDESTLLLDVTHVFLREPNGARRVAVKGARLGPKGIVLMTLEGVSGREAAEGLRGVELAVPRAALPEPDEGEWYFVDLIGLRAVDARGEAVGPVIDVVSYPSVDCLVVRMTDGIREVPVVEPWLVAVDVDGGTVTVGDIADLPIQKETRAPR